MSARFFGYGSLVNLATHDYPNARKDTATGWARSWLVTKGRNYATLSAVPDPSGTLHGITADVPNADWAALDLREAQYDRHTLPIGAAIYAVPKNNLANDMAAAPILLSYLDVVVQGYGQMFGESGIAHFAQTTRGWHMPVLNDRAAPIYPRHQHLSAEETRRVDALLGEIGSQIVTL